MLKRFLSLILALIIVSAPLLSGAGTVSAAQTSVDLEPIIAQQYDAYAQSLNPEGASEAVSRLVKHSIKNGGTLNMGATDKFSAGLFNSKLFRASFIHAATVAVEKMGEYNQSNCFMRGGLFWYDNDFSYENFEYRDNENGNEKDDPKLQLHRTASKDPYTGTYNSYDEGMILVVGTCNSRFTFKQKSVTKDTVTYKVSIKVMDKFDFFSADYSGDDKDLAKTITMLGKLLSFGVLNEFAWTVSAELELTLPNSCNHQSEQYRWEFDGENLFSITSENYEPNFLTKVAGSTENGIFLDTIYALDAPIRMHPDLPWSMEMKCKGKGWFAFSNSKKPTTAFYLRKAPDTIFFCEYTYKMGSSKDKATTQHGIYYTKIVGVSSKKEHTYRLTNRILDDGTNMVYLSIDGKEVGPLNQYFENGSSKNTTTDWVNGKKLHINYFGNNSYPLSEITFEYIHFWENGETPSAYDFCNISVKQPTCAEKGKTTYSCTRCGAVFSESIPMVDHDPVAIPGTASSCTESGLSEGSKCNSCGQILTEQTVIEPHGHSFEDRVCTACGEVEYALGDVDTNGNVDVDDVLALLWHVLFPDEYKIEVNADYDGSGTTDVDDVLALLWHVLFPEEYPLDETAKEIP